MKVTNEERAVASAALPRPAAHAVSPGHVSLKARDTQIETGRRKPQRAGQPHELPRASCFVLCPLKSCPTKSGAPAQFGNRLPHKRGNLSSIPNTVCCKFVIPALGSGD